MIRKNFLKMSPPLSQSSPCSISACTISTIVFVAAFFQLFSLSTNALAAEGFYNFTGLQWSLSSSDQGTGITGDAGVWTETIGGTITIAPFSFQQNNEEENYSLGVLQAAMFWNRLIVGGGIGNRFRDDKTDDRTPANYFTAKVFASVFLSSLSESWKGKWGLGVVLDYVPGRSETSISAGTVILF